MRTSDTQVLMRCSQYMGNSPYAEALFTFIPQTSHVCQSRKLMALD
jgi:hypothetical protein